MYLLQADQAIQQLHGTKVEIELQETNEGAEGYECEIEEMPSLQEDDGTDTQYDYNMEAIRQIQDAKVEIQQDGYNYTIDEEAEYKPEQPLNILNENVYNEFASEVIINPEFRLITIPQNSYFQSIAFSTIFSFQNFLPRPLRFPVPKPLVSLSLFPTRFFLCRSSDPFGKHFECPIRESGSTNQIRGRGTLNVPIRKQKQNH